MTEDEEYFLANTALDAHEWHGVGQLANALSIFEPLRSRRRVNGTARVFGAAPRCERVVIEWRGRG